MTTDDAAQPTPCTPGWTYDGSLFRCGCGHVHPVRDVDDADDAHRAHVAPRPVAAQATPADGDRALTRVVRAWRDPGPRPHVHAAEQAKLRRYWPTLAHALDALPASRPSAAQPTREQIAWALRDVEGRMGGRFTSEQISLVQADAVLALYGDRAAQPTREDITARVRQHLRAYTLPANVATYLYPSETHDTVAARCAPLITDAVLALYG